LHHKSHTKEQTRAYISAPAAHLMRSRRTRREITSIARASRICQSIAQKHQATLKSVGVRSQPARNLIRDGCCGAAAIKLNLKRAPTAALLTTPQSGAPALIPTGLCFAICQIDAAHSLHSIFATARAGYSKIECSRCRRVIATRPQPKWCGKGKIGCVSRCAIKERPPQIKIISL
jgi:hypothetical protein